MKIPNGIREVIITTLRNRVGETRQWFAEKDVDKMVSILEEIYKREPNHTYIHKDAAMIFAIEAMMQMFEYQNPYTYPYYLREDNAEN